MRDEVMKHYGFVKGFSQAGYYDTPLYWQRFNDIKSAIYAGRLIVVCGVVGSGKTTLMRRLRQQVRDEKLVIVAQSWSIVSVTLKTLTTALFLDLATEKPVRIPRQKERRENALHDLVRKRGRPIVLFIDDAHHLKDETLTDLQRLTDIVEEGGATLSIVLTGQPKLCENMRRASAKETRLRTDVFTLDGIAGNEREFLAWLLSDCSGGTIEPHAVLTAEAVNVLTSKLHTPLRMQWHLTEALEAGYRAGVSPVPVDLLATAFMTPL